MTKKVQEIIKNDDLKLVLCNQYGESMYFDNPTDVKPLTNKNVVRWYSDRKFDNVSPFTYAILYGKKDIWGAMFIKPMMTTSENTVEMVLW